MEGSKEMRDQAKSYHISMDLPENDNAVDSEDGVQTRINHTNGIAINQNSAVILVDRAQTEASQIPTKDAKQMNENVLLISFSTPKQMRNFALEKIMYLNKGLNIIWAPYTYIATIFKTDEIVLKTKAMVVLTIFFTLNLFFIKSRLYYRNLSFTSDVRSMGLYLLATLLQIPFVGFILFSLQTTTPMDVLLQVILLIFLTLECVFCVVGIRNVWKQRQSERSVMS